MTTIEDHLVRLEVEDFLWAEADLLDEHQYQDWLDLFTEDARYIMPIRRNVASKEMDTEYISQSTDMWWYNDDKSILEKRVKQLDMIFLQEQLLKGNMERMEVVHSTMLERLAPYGALVEA